MGALDVWALPTMGTARVSSRVSVSGCTARGFLESEAENIRPRIHRRPVPEVRRGTCALGRRMLGIMRLTFHPRPAMYSRTNLRFLDAPGEVAALMRDHDWSRSPLGPPEGWPQSLRSVASLLLRSKFPMFVAWGPSPGLPLQRSLRRDPGCQAPGGDRATVPGDLVRNLGRHQSAGPPRDGRRGELHGKPAADHAAKGLRRTHLVHVLLLARRRRAGRRRGHVLRLHGNHCERDRGENAALPRCSGSGPSSNRRRACSRSPEGGIMCTKSPILRTSSSSGAKASSG